MKNKVKILLYILFIFIVIVKINKMPKNTTIIKNNNIKSRK